MSRARRADVAGDACEAFIRWYSSAGHWIHDGRAEAARTWIERGITTLASAPPNAAQLLADWVESDPMPPLLARLRADEVAMRAPVICAADTDGAIWLPMEVNHG